MGVKITSDGSTSSDVDRFCSSFLAQFNSMFHKFNFMGLDTLKFLFVYFCSSFYGVESWYDFMEKHSSFKNISISYHKSLKRMCNLNVWDSNHMACSLLGMNTFKHFLAKRCLKFFIRMIKSTEPCIKPLRFYFILQSAYVRKLRELFKNVYWVDDYLINDCDALIAKVDYVQCHEQTSYYVRGI